MGLSRRIDNYAERDRKKAMLALVAMSSALLALALCALLFWPHLAAFSDAHLAPGLGVKDAALASFVVTLLTFVVFAVVAGDGLIGELQFMLLGFFLYYLVFWFLIAWVL